MHGAANISFQLIRQFFFRATKTKSMAFSYEYKTYFLWTLSWLAHSVTNFLEKRGLLCENKCLAIIHRERPIQDGYRQILCFADRCKFPCSLKNPRATAKRILHGSDWKFNCLASTWVVIECLLIQSSFVEAVFAEEIQFPRPNKLSIYFLSWPYCLAII